MTVRFRVELSPQARDQLSTINIWWARNRSAAPTLVAAELGGRPTERARHRARGLARSSRRRASSVGSRRPRRKATIGARSLWHLRLAATPARKPLTPLLWQAGGLGLAILAARTRMALRRTAGLPALPLARALLLLATWRPCCEDTCGLSISPWLRFVQPSVAWPPPPPWR